MGRRQTIDRGALLDAAERVVLRDGAAHLTIDAVAAEAGVSKGGVLYAFASKDALIDAMLARVYAAFDRIADDYLEKAGDTPVNRVRAHVEASRTADPDASDRAVVLMASFMRSPKYREGALEYYKGLIDRLDTTTPAGRQARVALLATEGAAMLRGCGFYPFSQDEWGEIHQDVITKLLS